MDKQQTLLPASLRHWLEAALADAERRQLPHLRPLLESLARSTSALRAASWNWQVDERTRDGQ